MADTKLTALNALASVTDDDILYVVDDPAGTPASKKITAANLMAGKLANVVEDTTPQLCGDLDAQGNNITSLGVLKLTEQAEADADVAGQGQIWVDTATPNVLKFTDDDGTDFTLAHDATTSLPSLGTVSTGLTGVLRADSGVLAADTDVTDLVDNIAVSQLADGTDGELITWDADGAPAVVATGTATHVLTSNGAGEAPTFQAAAGGAAGSTTWLRVAGTGETAGTSARWAQAVTSGGTVANGATGVLLSTSLSSTSSARTQLTVYGTEEFDNDFEGNAQIWFSAAGVAATQAYFIQGGITVAGAGFTIGANDYVGFKIDYNGTDCVISAVNAGGSGETATALLTGLSKAGSVYYVRWIFTSETNCVFHIASEGGSVATATHTTNLPTSFNYGPGLFAAVSNVGTTSSMAFRLGAYDLVRTSQV